ncbi:MAG: murein hydrolase activator EnvC family protein [Prochlorothrix sp.]
MRIIERRVAKRTPQHPAGAPPIDRNGAAAIFLGLALALGLGLGLGAGWGSLPSWGQTAPETGALEQYQQRLEQYRQGLGQEQQRLQALEQLSQAAIAQLQRSLQSTGSDLEAIDRQWQVAQQTLSQLQDSLGRAQAAYLNQQSQVAARLRWLQQQPRTQGLAVLLRSSNLSELLAQTQRLKRLYEADRHSLQGLQSQYQVLMQQRSTLEAQRNNLALVRQQLLAQRSQTELQVQAQEALTARLQTDRLALEAAQAQLERDSAAITQLIQSRSPWNAPRSAPGAPPGLPRNGRLRYPVNGPISSNFGWRDHPVLGTRRLHAGMDFAVDYDTPIGAAAPGTVIAAGWQGGYGNAVILDHGQGITTLYAHASALNTREGDRVQAGQIIAWVGSTGLSTGPHLHFEVRENGEPVEPRTYL